MIQSQPPQDRPGDTDADTLERDDTVIGTAFRWSLVAIAVLATVAGGSWYWFTREPAQAASQSSKLVLPDERTQAPAEVPRVTFTDITRQAGITFVHENGAYGDKLLPETMGGGCAFFDYDNDGDQDLLLINSTWWEGHRPADAPPTTSALLRNDGAGNFDDVSDASGLAIDCYGMGVAVGDYDNDGWVDVFLSAVGPDHLFHNDAGTFSEVSSEAGVAGGSEAWGTSCGWIDYDNDGDLDLFVCNYIEWNKEIDLSLNCRLTGHGRAYCRPDAFAGAFPYLYRNDGDGKFSDVSESAGVQVKNRVTGVPVSKSLGLAPADLDGDGWIDLVVANDTVQNLLLHNQGNGQFKEVGESAGLAFDTKGNARGAMGADSCCLRNDEIQAVGIGNFANEEIALYVAERNSMLFSDDAIATGLGPPSRLMLKFGLFFFDYDRDGRLDVLTANGHLEDEIHKVQKSQHYEQPPQLFWNGGPEAESEFVLVEPERLGPDFSKPMVGRGATYADIDADGDLDVLITAIRGAPRLLRNEQAAGHHWLRVKLQGTRCNRDAIGAWVQVEAGGKVQSRQVMPTRSYLSQSELPVSFGLGNAKRAARVSIRWPDGSQQEIKNVVADQVLSVTQAPVANP